ncbi:MAG: beta-galactosidase [Paludibacter sp.]|nr:beta-galactosidase [Paludibacter sp.]
MSKHILSILLALVLSVGLSSAQQVQNGDFAAGKNEFTLNGKPFIIRAGEIHYSRIPKAYWDHRIKLAKAMGMNTVCIYLFWNYHEQEQGVFDFSGEKDVAEFVRLIQKNGMYCILRPGPYVCAEWDMGGLPWWLLKKKDLKVRRRSDEFFMDRVKIYLNEVGKQLAPLQIQNGGPIIMVQVENEYGTWGDDQKYMEIMRDNLREVGFNKAQLLRCDWSSNFYRYKLDGAVNALNFGAGSNIDDQFRKFKEVNPTSPLMCGEYWTGWFDQWGRPHETRNISSFIGSLKDMMDRKISFSLYMAHGGTSFGQWAGANAPAYAPTTSSYDYNAPIDEGGNPTDKFYAIRDLLKNYLQEGETLPEIPANPEKTITIPAITFKQTANLFENLPAAKQTENIQPMEFFDQGWGSILYRKQISACDHKQKLIIRDVHDWAIVYINGKAIGKLDRRRGENTIELPILKSKARLDILVEGMGRVNYGEAIIDRKGITDKVLLSDGKTETELKNWSVYNFPVDYNSQLKAKFQNKMATGPAWYKATFELTETGYTYLNMSAWGKGMVWVNGHNLGRFWKIGPTQTLCVPGCFLKKGANEIIVFDLDKQPANTISGLNHAILDVIGKDDSQQHKAAKSLNLNGKNPVVAGTLAAGSGWKTVNLDETTTGRYFCFEALNAQDANDNSSSIAEFEILGEDGKAISSINWKVVFVDSEETTKAANGADKLFDIQESIIWQTKIGDKTSHPHQIVIDMGKDINVKGFRILPRSDKSIKGIVKDYRFYLEKSAFKFQ